MMKIHLQQQVAFSDDELLRLLTDHEQLSRFFNATFKVVKQSHQVSLNGGVGCLREVTTRGNTFTEEIIKADCQGIEYRIVGDKPLKNHLGTIKFIANEQGVNIDYCITGQSASWIPTFIMMYVVKKDIHLALTRLAKYGEQHKELNHGC